MKEERCERKVVCVKICLIEACYEPISKNQYVALRKRKYPQRGVFCIEQRRVTRTATL